MGLFNRFSRFSTSNLFFNGKVKSEIREWGTNQGPVYLKSGECGPICGGKLNTRN
jgi:hypothetical protein